MVQQTQTEGPTSVNLAIAAPVTQPLEVTLPIVEPLTAGHLEIRAIATGEVITAIEFWVKVRSFSGLKSLFSQTLKSHARSCWKPKML